jgi:hypothetical protein
MAVVYNTKPIVTSGLVILIDACIFPPQSSGTSHAIWSNLLGGTSMSLQNGPVYSSEFGGVFSFDGSNDSGLITLSPSNYGMTSTHTWCSWIRRTANANSGHIWGPLGFNSGIVFGGNAFSANWHYGSDFNLVHVAQAPSESVLNRWYYVNTVVDNITGFIKLYVDGVEVASKTFSPMTNMWNGWIRLAGGDYSNSPITVGCVSAYSRVLTTAEIQQNFNALRGRYGI